MTQPTPQTISPASPTPTAEHPHDGAEGFWAVVLRRSRYVLAIGLSAFVFSWLGGMIASPDPSWAGFSIGVWQGQSILATLGLAAILLVMTAICSLIVHPDNPHMGLFCSLAGMAALSIRGGTAHMLIVYGQLHHNLPSLALAMALECIQWAAVALLADYFARIVHDKLLANHQWLLRAESDLGKRAMAKSRLGAAVGISKVISGMLHTDKIKGPIRIPLAMIWSGGIAFLLLSCLMQSQLKGQVLMACFVAFLTSTICAYFAFPTAPFWSFILAVPLTGAVAYWLGRNGVPIYPGHAPTFAMRALPIDYLSAGVPGAILGLYWSLGWALGGAEE